MSPASAGISVLVVDHEQLIRNVVRAALIREGYEVLEASTASEAYRIARDGEHRIDLLIVNSHLTQQPRARWAGHPVQWRGPSTRPAAAYIAR